MKATREVSRGRERDMGRLTPKGRGAPRLNPSLASECALSSPDLLWSGLRIQAPAGARGLFPPPEYCVVPLRRLVSTYGIR
jgi:hypothetical protein